MMEEVPESSAEIFLDTASEKIIQALSDSQDSIRYKWAVSFLQRAARGFGDVNHEPWIGPLSLKECSEVLLKTYKQFLRNSDFEFASLNSVLRTAVRSSLNVNDFISELVTVIVDGNDCENIIMDAFPQKNMKAPENLPRGLLMSMGTNPKEGNCSYVNPLKRLPSTTEFEFTDGKSSEKRSVRLCKHRKENINEVKDLLNDIWFWVKNGRVQLSSDITGKLLSSLPERVEEVMMNIALEMIKNSLSRKDPASPEKEGFKGSRRRESINNEAYIVNSIFLDNELIIGAAATSPKLFQMCSSVLNQLLIQSSGCSDAWSAMLTLCSSFAKETAQRRAAFYPVAVQSAVVWMDVEPGKIDSKEYKEEVHRLIRNTLKELPPETAVALFSHFPEWLPYVDLISILHCHR